MTQANTPSLPASYAPYLYRLHAAELVASFWRGDIPIEVGVYHYFAKIASQKQQWHNARAMVVATTWSDKAAIESMVSA